MPSIDRGAIVHIARRANLMSAADTARRRDHFYRALTLLLAVAFVPAALVIGRRGAAAQLACRWALALRFPAENLAGLHPSARAAFETARTRAFWRHGQLIGVTSGFRPAEHQARLYAAAADRQTVLPPHESRHVAGTALDVRPVEGARWLERHGALHQLYRVYDNEWWHFEYRPEGRPERLPHPGASLAQRELVSGWPF
jgi:D-alanyl-D-alanine carboxypeptidase